MRECVLYYLEYMCVLCEWGRESTIMSEGHALRYIHVEGVKGFYCDLLFGSRLCYHDLWLLRDQKIVHVSLLSQKAVTVIRYSVQNNYSLDSLSGNPLYHPVLSIQECKGMQYQGRERERKRENICVHLCIHLIMFTEQSICYYVLKKLLLFLDRWSKPCARHAGTKTVIRVQYQWLLKQVQWCF